MEEHVGEIWDRLITRAARAGHADAAVTLEEVSHTVGILFRALGGDGGLRVEAADPTAYRMRRSWLQRIAGVNRRVELAWRDEQSLRLPASVDVFPSRDLNRSLYLWLAALASGDTGEQRPWLEHNQRLTQDTLECHPGLISRYQQLVDAHLALRPDLEALPEDEQAQERAIRDALRQPGSIERLPPANRPPQPVPLWLHPAPPIAHSAKSRADGGEDMQAEDSKRQQKSKRRRRAEHAESPENKGGLLALRMEALLGNLAEFVKLDRSTDEEDLDDPDALADDADTLHVARDNKITASRIRFDLDLPSAASDDQPVGEGIALPEWDYRKAILRPRHCLLQPMVAADVEPGNLPAHLEKLARKLRNQFQALAPARIWRRAQPDGSEVDLDAYERFVAQRATGRAVTDGRLYRDLVTGGRDLACLLLADFSMSTDAYVNNHNRIIDVIRDGMYLFAEALNATGDQFAMFGFSSRHRDHVRFHVLKEFDEPYSSIVRGRLRVVKPGFYTRMGAAIRHSTRLLAERPASRRLLLLITDGKPNDLDQYEGRYGVEDTRAAVLEARRQGLQPFCVTIDDEGGDYLPHLFGAKGFVIIRRPSELPRQLPLLYAQLTQ